MNELSLINAMDAIPTYGLERSPNNLMSNGYPLLAETPPKEDYTIHKFVGPAIAAGVTGGLFGASMNPKSWRRAALVGAAAGAANAMLFRAIIRGYAKATKVPYKEVIATDKQLLLKGHPTLKKQAVEQNITQNFAKQHPEVFKPKKLEKKVRSYGETLAITAPIFATKAILGDIPRKTIEETIEQKNLAKIKKMPIPTIKSVAGKAFTGRGLRTAAIGGGIGILTAPVFIKGVQLAGSDDLNTKAKGVGLIVGSGAIYQAAKGFGEGSGVAKSRGLGKPARISKGISYSIGRILLKSPAAVATGLAIAAGRKKKDGKDPSFGKKYVLPALTGAAIGSLQNVVNTVIDAPKGLPVGVPEPSKLQRVGATLPVTGGRVSERGLRRRALLTRKGFRSLVPAGKSGAIGGLLGGFIAATVVDKAIKALKSKEKKASVAEHSLLASAARRAAATDRLRESTEHNDFHGSWRAPWEKGRTSKAVPWWAKIHDAQGSFGTNNLHRLAKATASRIPDPDVKAHYIANTDLLIRKYRKLEANKKIGESAKQQRREALANILSKGPAG